MQLLVLNAKKSVYVFGCYAKSTIIYEKISIVSNRGEIEREPFNWINKDGRQKTS